MEGTGVSESDGTGDVSIDGAVTLNLDGAFESEQVLREAVAACRLCFDHEPFLAHDGGGRLVQVGFQLNLYAAFHDPRYLPGGDDAELTQLLGLLRTLCRVIARSLTVLKPCTRPEPPMHRVVYAPERQYRAEVCLQVPFVEVPAEGRPPQEREGIFLAAAERVLLTMGARRSRWDVKTEPVS